jgi:hypothetical protein
MRGGGGGGGGGRGRRGVVRCDDSLIELESSDPPLLLAALRGERCSESDGKVVEVTVIALLCLSGIVN